MRYELKRYDLLKLESAIQKMVEEDVPALPFYIHEQNVQRDNWFGLDEYIGALREAIDTDKIRVAKGTTHKRGDTAVLIRTDWDFPTAQEVEGAKETEKLWKTIEAVKEEAKRKMEEGESLYYKIRYTKMGNHRKNQLYAILTGLGYYIVEQPALTRGWELVITSD